MNQQIVMDNVTEEVIIISYLFPDLLRTGYWIECHITKCDWAMKTINLLDCSLFMCLRVTTNTFSLFN